MTTSILGNRRGASLAKVAARVLSTISGFLAFLGFFLLATGAIVLDLTYEPGVLIRDSLPGAFGPAYLFIGYGKIVVGCAFLTGLFAATIASDTSGRDRGGRASRPWWVMVIGGAAITIGFWLVAMSPRLLIEKYLRAQYTGVASDGLQWEGVGYAILAIGFAICLESLPVATPRRGS